MGSCRAIVPVSKICQSCGTEFACLGACCWCGEITLSDAARADLRTRFSDCLCRACLEAAAVSQSIPVPPPPAG
jgi:hypothetical protein